MQLNTTYFRLSNHHILDHLLMVSLIFINVTKSLCSSTRHLSKLQPLCIILHIKFFFIVIQLFGFTTPEHEFECVPFICFDKKQKTIMPLLLSKVLLEPKKLRKAGHKTKMAMSIPRFPHLPSKKGKGLRANLLRMHML